MDLTIGKGEILGLAGLLSSGRTETARLVFGIDKAIQTGEMLRGQAKAPLIQISTARRFWRGVRIYTPENRKSDGIIPHLSIRENIVLALQAQQGA